MSDVIDLRSDTVTKPTQAMREAMYRAEVGDDVFSEDPSINALEARAAELTGKEAALLVTSGTMGNLVCTTTHCSTGDEVILGETSHIYTNEVGGIAAIGNLLTHTLPDTVGYPEPAAVAAAIRSSTLHAAGTKLICVEQTHNQAGGAVVPLDVLSQLRRVADEHHVQVHMDGARLFNAAVALGVPASDVARYAHTLSFCLSKGLSAPVGSVVCGSRDFIARARRRRKMYGGGMRQAGILAAAGLVAFDQMIDRLAEDHATARQLANGLAELPGIVLDPTTVRTNIVRCEFDPAVISASALSPLLAKEGVLALQSGANRIRFVTHDGITSADVDRALVALRRILTAERPAVPTSAAAAAY